MIEATLFGLALTVWAWISLGLCVLAFAVALYDDLLVWRLWELRAPERFVANHQKLQLHQYEFNRGRTFVHGHSGLMEPPGVRL